MDTVVRDPFFADVPELFGAAFPRMVQHRDPECWPAFERGQLDEASFFQRFYRLGAPSSLPKAQDLKEAIVTRYRFNDDMEHLLMRLAAGPDLLWALSNYPCWFSIIRQELKLDRFFAGYSISYRTGLRKPEPAAYQQVFHASGRRKNEMLLVDDREQNCTGAEQCGWRAIRFQGATHLKEQLRQLGIES